MDKQTLQKLFEGHVILPADDNYDEARRTFYGGTDKKPAVIVRVANAEDVRQAVLLAKAQGLEIAVRSGGHSLAGYSASDGGIVIDLRDLKKIDVNAEDKTVWAETGLTAAELTNELDKHNLAIGFGDIGSVGIGGITTGGGVGFLLRKFGMTIDNLLAAEIVTADGEILQADEKNNSDLFWAIRGGGSNFGVVTRFMYRLHELGDCYGGMLLLPSTPETISGVIELSRNAPDELSVIVNVMTAFPLPFVPQEYHGKMSVMALMVYAGDPQEGEKVIAPFKALAKPYADLTRPMRYKDIFFPDDGFHPTAVSRTMYLNDVDLALAQEAAEWLEKTDAPIRALQLRVLGGAMARVPDDATAYAHRQKHIMANILAFYEAEAEKAPRQQWVDEFASAIHQDDDSAYVGFLGSAEQDRLNDAYPEQTLNRLKAVKRTYDPENLFKLNVNIPPGA